MPLFFYSLVLVLLQPLVLLRLLCKSIAAPAYRGRVLERYGLNAPQLDESIWVHAVSVGEAITARPLIEHLLKQGDQVVVTTTTPTGAEQVQRMFGDRVIHRYLPQDIPVCLSVFIKAIKPRQLIVMETELWPNLVKVCARNGVPVVLVNGRLSAGSARGYGRFASLSKQMLQSLDALCVQTETEKQRFVGLGAEPNRCYVIPSLKFEASLTEHDRNEAQRLVEQWQIGQRFVWIAASTHPGEDEIALLAHKQLLQTMPTALLILVPRHPERFDSVVKLSEDSGLLTQRFSAQANRADAQVLIGDVMGKLLQLYGTADVAFVGGSLNGGGGHNLIEPALWSMPVLSGPGRFNFQAISDQMLEAGGLVLVDDANSFAKELVLLADATKRLERGNALKTVAQRNTGGLEQTLRVLAQTAQA